MHFICNTHTGLQRNNNQDSMGNYELNKGSLFIVCDGVSALPNGKLASKIAIQSIYDFCLSSTINPKKKLVKALQNAHLSILKKSDFPMGTTVVALYIIDKIAYVAWCGDSRIYHFRNHAIQWISKDHNVLHDILNRGLGKGNLFQNPQALTRFLGNKPNSNIDYYEFKVRKMDTIILCSDGLHNFVSETDLLYTVANNVPEMSNKILEKQLLSKGVDAPDNFTWYIIEI